jgi:serine/threonine-protein kinase
VEPGACIDVDTLADMFARGSSATSRDSVEKHLDACSACRTLVAAYARASDDSAEVSAEVALAQTMPSVPPAAAEAAQAGQLLATRYFLEHVVGEGGMGVVWAAQDLVAGRRVAVKFIKDASPELARRSWREARASAFVGHPSLVETLDVIPPKQEGHAPVLVMPLLEGESLDKLLARKGKLEVREALEILEPVVAGMCAAHGKGVLHRDLKPQNVFLAQDGSGEITPLVLDFGLAKILADGSDAAADKLTRTGALLGTPYYMAPEQLFGDSSVDARADVWAVGAMLYECLSGKRPVDGKSYGQIARNVARGTIAPLAGVDPALSDVIAKMLDKDREGRPSLAQVHAIFRMVLDRR